MALATSDTSARVGRGLLTMLSNIWVAVITGIPNLLAVVIRRFCRIGTSSAGNSTPKSPLATITPSHKERMASICSIASCFSILAITGIDLPALEMRSLISRISWGLRTKLRAIQSTP